MQSQVVLLRKTTLPEYASDSQAVKTELAMKNRYKMLPGHLVETQADIEQNPYKKLQIPLRKRNLL